MDLVGLQVRGLAAVVDHLGGKEVELYIGVSHAGVAPHEAAGLQVGGGSGARPVEEPLDPHLDHPQSLLLAVESDGLRAALDDVELQVVLQVLANSRQVVDRLYADTAQVISSANTGEKQQLGGVDGSTTQDYFLCKPLVSALLNGLNTQIPPRIFLVFPFSTISIPTAFFPSKTTFVTRTLFNVERF